MNVDVKRVPVSVNDAAEMIQPWLGEPGMMTDIFAQVEQMGLSQRQQRDAKRTFRLALDQIRKGDA